MQPQDAVRELARRGIIIHDRVRDAFSAHVLDALSAAGAIRISLAHYNTPGEVDRFLDAMTDVLGS